MKTLLIVSGSRSCADSKEKTDWVQSELIRATRFMGPDDVVLSGASPCRTKLGNPDIWARELAIFRQIPMSEFRLDGYRWKDNQPTGRSWWDLADAGGGKGRSTPLARNHAMIEAGKRAAATGWDVWLLGFVDPTSTTFGTGYTCRLGREAGLSVCEMACPTLLDDKPDRLPIPEILFVDTETTGLDTTRCGMLELAMVRVNARTLVEKACFEVRVPIEPWMQVSQQALEINGYTPEKWADAVPTRRAMELALASKMFANEPRLAGHNVRFDRAVIANAFEQAGMAMPRTTLPDICTKEMGRAIGMPKYRLHDLCDRYGISNEGEHRAMVDVRRTIAVYPRVLEELRTKTLPLTEASP